MNKRALLLSVELFMLSVIMFLCVMLICYIGNGSTPRGESMAASFETADLPTVIIDPGHGGEDGGAVGVNGCAEKDINLAIARILWDMLNTSGIDTVMTRYDDVLLYDEGIPGKKKIQDVRNRVAVTEKYDNCILVSVHMNTYPSPKYSGAQVYYSPNNPQSNALAVKIQKYITEYIQPNNTRQVKKADSGIYILDKARVPAVLAECGFISCPDEAELLCNNEYQRLMATVIYAAITDHINEGR